MPEKYIKYSSRNMQSIENRKFRRIMGRRRYADILLEAGVWVPMTTGTDFLPWAENLESTINLLIAGGADVIVAHKGDLQIWPLV